MLALFRLIDVTRGHVCIGGVDAASIALDSLRSQLAIIPQVGLMFFFVLSKLPLAVPGGPAEPVVNCSSKT